MKKIFSEKEIKEIAEVVLSCAQKSKSKKAVVVALQGDLGAGKTTLSQAIAKKLGIKEKVISPTFVIMKNYELRVTNYEFKKLIHIDAYRLEKDKELLNLGWKEMISNPENLILIEWPERVAKIIPKDSIRIKLSHEGDLSRCIDIVFSK